MAKSKNQSASSVAVLFVFGLLLSGVYGVDKSMNSGSSQDDDGGGENTGPVDTCADGIDNDADGTADADDAECDQFSPYYDGNEDTPDDQLGGGPP